MRIFFKLFFHFPLDKRVEMLYTYNNNFLRGESIMDNRVLFGVMCIIFNSYGVPCFMQKRVKTGILRIVLAMVTCGIIGIINVVKGIILGVQVLKMSDEEFAEKKYSLTSGIPA